LELYVQYSLIPLRRAWCIARNLAFQCKIWNFQWYSDRT